VRLVAVRPTTAPLVGHELQDIKRHMPNLECRIPAIYRRDRGIVPKGITVIEPNDEVFFLARKQDISSVMRELRRMERPVKKVMIAGGGNIGRRLARSSQLRRQGHRSQQDRQQPAGRTASPHAGPAGRRDRRGVAGTGKHRRHGCVLCAHQR
jgi:hypothetical protein